jgi:hypothetical protein
MDRVDLYTTIHKAVRALLFETAALAARTDPGDAEEVTALAVAVRRLVRLLDDHAEHEDAEVLPVLARFAPELHADLQGEHARTDGLQRELHGMAERLRASRGEERASLVRRVHERLCRLTAEHLRHMDREETEAMRALWAHCSDQELDQIHQRILRSIPPPVMAEWAAVMLPAMSLPERTAMLTPMARQLPRPVLEDLIAPARAALGDRWGATARAAGL